MRVPVKVLFALFGAPALLWSLAGLGDLIQKGLYGHTLLPPLHFRIHTVTLLSLTSFFLTAFLLVRPRRPVRNFLIPLPFLFLSMAAYELVFFVFMSRVLAGAPPPGRPSPAPLPIPLLVLLSVLAGPGSVFGVLIGLLWLWLLDLKLRFLNRGRRGFLLFLVGFVGFLVVMTVLHCTGFFREVHLYLSGRTPHDPHNLLWLFSKVLCVWMFFPLIKRA